MKLALGNAQSLRHGTNRLPAVDHPQSVSLELLIIFATVFSCWLWLLHMTLIVRHTRVAQIRTTSIDEVGVEDVSQASISTPVGDLNNAKARRRTRRSMSAGLWVGSTQRHIETVALG